MTIYKACCARHANNIALKNLRLLARIINGDMGMGQIFRQPLARQAWFNGLLERQTRECHRKGFHIQSRPRKRRAASEFLQIPKYKRKIKPRRIADKHRRTVVFNNSVYPLYKIIHSDFRRNGCPRGTPPMLLVLTAKTTLFLDARQRWVGCLS